MRTLTTLALLIASATAYADTYTVTTTSDVVADDSACSLREAIDAANGNPHADCPVMASATVNPRVKLPAGTFVLAGSANDDANRSGDLDLTHSVQLVGDGPGNTIVSAGQADRVIDCHGALNVAMQGVSLRDGAASGAAIYCPIGIVSLALVEISDSAGSSIVEAAQLGMQLSVVRRSRSEEFSIGAAGALTVSTTTFVDNVASSTLLLAGTLHLSSSTLDSNVASQLVSAPAGFLLYSTIVDNQARVGNDPMLAVENSIVTGNMPCAQPLASLGGNLVDPSSTCVHVVGSDRTSADPQLEPLAPVGMFMPTRRPRPDSPAVDIASCTAVSATVTSDERRALRQQGVRCDAGAVERGRTLVEAQGELPGPNCASGGVAVRSGEDRSGDGVLARAEVEQTTYRCNTAGVLVTATPVAPGESGSPCTSSGVRIDRGADLDGEGTLAPAEVQESTYVCDATGELVVVSAESMGAHCTAGGQRVDVGADLDRDGVLANSEIQRTTYVCRETTELVDVVDEPSGIHCPDGGQRVDVGVDVNGDGVLQPEEVSSTSYACTQEVDVGGCNASGGGASGTAFALIVGAMLAYRRARRSGRRRTSACRGDGSTTRPRSRASSWTPGDRMPRTR